MMIMYSVAVAFQSVCLHSVTLYLYYSISAPVEYTFSISGETSRNRLVNHNFEQETLIRRNKTSFRKAGTRTVIAIKIFVPELELEQRF